jgi:integrase
MTKPLTADAGPKRRRSTDEPKYMTEPLTAAQVKRLKPGPQRLRIRDLGARSLFLVIEPSGHKSWAMRFRRPDGRPAKLTIGPVDMSGHELQGDPEIGQPLTLAAARALAANIHRQRALKQDVIGDHKVARHRQRTVIDEHAASTFAVAVRDYINGHAKPHTRNWVETARLLGLRYADEKTEPEVIKGGLAERWADKPVRNIGADDIWVVIDEARESGVPGLAVRKKGHSEARARLLFVALSSLFSWLQKPKRVGGRIERRIEINPCKGADRPEPATARERVLTKDEVRWFWRATDAVGEPFTTIFKLLLLTGARLSEVAGMRREELHDGSMWRLPGERTKNKRPHVVPLPPAAQALIAVVPGDEQIIFTTTGDTAPSGWSRVKQRLDAAMLKIAKQDRRALPPWRLHDLRRTAVTGMVELGVAPHLVELIINHVGGHKAGVAGTYNRAEMLEERKAALERWAAHVAQLVDGGAGERTVVPLRGVT